LNKYLITDISKIVVDLYDDDTHIPNTIYEVYLSKDRGYDGVQRSNRYYSCYRDATEWILSFANEEYCVHKKTLIETGSVSIIRPEADYHFTLKEIALKDLVH